MVGGVFLSVKASRTVQDMLLSHTIQNKKLHEINSQLSSFVTVQQDVLRSQQRLVQAQQSTLSALISSYERWIQANTFAIPVKVTAYNALPEQTDDTPFINASNQRVREGTCAISIDLEKALGLKFGDIVVLKGIGVFTFQDRMHTRKQRQVDVFFWDKRRAVEFGVKQTEMFVFRDV